MFRFTSWTSLSFLCAACGVEGGLPLDSSGPDAGVLDAGSVPDSGFDAGPRVDAGQDGGDLDAAPPDASDPAVLVPGASAVEGTIDPPGEVDGYALDGVPGEFIWITAEWVRSSDIDPVVELYDPTGQRVAAVDDLSPDFSGSRDAEIIYRLTAAGRYVVRVHDWMNWSGDPRGPRGGPTFTYRLTALWLGEVPDRETVAPEIGDSLADAFPVVTSTGVEMIVASSFQHPNDVDVYRFSLPTSAVFRADLMPMGVPGYGGTSTAARLVMTSSRGIEAVAPLNRLSGLRVPLEAGPHDLRIEHSGAPLGANPFYAIKALAERFSGHYLEPRPNDNDDLDDPALFELRPDFATQIFGTLPPGDSDYLAFTTPVDRPASIFCFSKGWGSGVDAFTATIYDQQLNVYDADTETYDDQVYLPRIFTGFVIGLTRGEQLLDNPSAFYVCEIW